MKNVSRYLTALVIALPQLAVAGTFVDPNQQSAGEQAFLSTAKQNAEQNNSNNDVLKSWANEPKASLPEWGPKAGDATILSEADAQYVFKEVAKDPFISWNTPENGCNARAHEAGRVLDSNGITSIKIFVTSAELNTKLHLSYKFAGKYPKESSWDYHVATAVLVKTASGQLVPYMLDPSAFDHAVPMSQWVASLTSKKPNMKINIAYRDQRYYDDTKKVEDLKVHDRLTDTDKFGGDFMFKRVFVDLQALQLQLWSTSKSVGIECQQFMIPKRRPQYLPQE